MKSVHMFLKGVYDIPLVENKTMHNFKAFNSEVDDNLKSKLIYILVVLSIQDNVIHCVRN